MNTREDASPGRMAVTYVHKGDPKDPTLPKPQVAIALDSLTQSIDAPGGLRDLVGQLYAKLDPIMSKSESTDPARPLHGFDAPVAHTIDIASMALEEIKCSVKSMIQKVQI